MRRTAKLTDHDGRAPFLFKLGDKVALVRHDGTPDPDPESQGVIVEGISDYDDAGGAFGNVYDVKRADGKFFRAKDADIVKRP